MAIDPVTALLDVGKMAIERIWPDPTERAKQQIALAELGQKGDLAELTARVQLLSGQNDVNLQEAKHKSIFVAGWRPFIGWVCGFGLAYNFLVYQFLLWMWAIAVLFSDSEVTAMPPPALDIQELIALVLGMLGLAGHRSYDKKQKTETNSI